MTRDTDALLLVSFGGPEGPEDVLPFLRNVTRGRDVPDSRLATVAEQYLAVGGRSPINDQNRALLAALRNEIPELPVYWGNRNWKPYLADTVRQLAADGIRRAAVFVTSAFPSYSGCRQYREDLAEAAAPLGDRAPEFVKLRLFFDHPGFVEPMIDRCLAALAELPEQVRAGAHLVFTAHSLPVAQARASGRTGGEYSRRLEATAAVMVAEIARRTGVQHPFELAYCSRSGSPQVPWLGPDIGARLEGLAAAGAAGAVIVPLGFVSDHMEVVYDLDVRALARARELDLPAVRAGTVGVDPRFVGMVRELLVERGGTGGVRRALTDGGPWPEVCPPHCCEPRVRRPAAAGTPGDLLGLPVPGKSGTSEVAGNSCGSTQVPRRVDATAMRRY